MPGPSNQCCAVSWYCVLPLDCLERLRVQAAEGGREAEATSPELHQGHEARLLDVSGCSTRADVPGTTGRRLPHTDEARHCDELVNGPLRVVVLANDVEHVPSAEEAPGPLVDVRRARQDRSGHAELAEVRTVRLVRLEPTALGAVPGPVEHVDGVREVERRDTGCVVLL